MSYTGPERRNDDPLHKLATAAAGDALDRRHRGMLRDVVITGLVTSILIAGIVAWLVTSQGNDAAHRYALYNCRHDGRLADIEAGFISSDAKDRQGALSKAQRTQVLIGFAKLFPVGFIRRAARAQQTLDEDTIAYWQGPRKTSGPFAGAEPLLQQARDLQRVDCQAALG